MFNNSFANATVCGFVGRDARIVETPAGTSMTTISVAVTTRTRHSDGSYVDATQWIGASFFGKEGDKAAGVKKGELVVITGEPKVRTYVNAKGRSTAMLELRDARLTRVLRPAALASRRDDEVKPAAPAKESLRKSEAEAETTAQARPVPTAPADDYAAEQEAFEADNRADDLS